MLAPEDDPFVGLWLRPRRARPLACRFGGVGVAGAVYDAADGITTEPGRTQAT
jgi:hypothetical protein